MPLGVPLELWYVSVEWPRVRTDCNRFVAVEKTALTRCPVFDTTPSPAFDIRREKKEKRCFPSFFEADIVAETHLLDVRLSAKPANAVVLNPGPSEQRETSEAGIYSTRRWFASQSNDGNLSSVSESEAQASNRHSSVLPSKKSSARLARAAESSKRQAQSHLLTQRLEIVTKRTKPCLRLR